MFRASPPVQLPTVGEVYKVRGDVQIPSDKKWDRRAVVVGVPADVDGRVRIVTRTSDLQRSGVPSMKDFTLGFDLDGVWGYYRSVDARLWVPPSVTYVGVLDVSVVKAIYKFFGIRGPVS
jgi:hypothetical protein